MTGYGEEGVVLEGVQGALRAAEACMQRARALSEELREGLRVLTRAMDDAPDVTRSPDLGDVAPYDAVVGVTWQWATSTADRCDRSHVTAAEVVEELEQASSHVRRARVDLTGVDLTQVYGGEQLTVLAARAEALADLIEVARPIAQAAAGDLGDAGALARRQAQVSELGVLPRRGDLDRGVVRADGAARHLITAVDVAEVSASRSAREATHSVEAVARRRLGTESRRGAPRPATASPPVAGWGL